VAGGRDGLRTRLRALFLDELDEHVGLLNRGLLTLERGADGESRGDVVTELFRSAHSLKGAAHSAGVDAVAMLCHRLEDVLAGMRDGSIDLAAVSLEPLFAAVDAIAAAAARLRAGEEVSSDVVDEAIVGLSSPLPRRAGRDPEHADSAPPAVGASGAASEPDGGQPPRAERDRAQPAPAVDPVAPRAAGDGTSVRVATTKLESLLNQAGELLLACHRVSALAAEVTATAYAFTRRPAGPVPKSGGAGGDHDSAFMTAGREMERLAGVANQADRVLSQVGQALARGVREVRMLPFAHACDGLDRVVRDLGKAGGKEVALQVHGGDVELDRPVLQVLRESLVHLVRNAVDHGIETPDERRASGKPATGLISVSASVQGGGVEVSVNDDGAGIDATALRTEAARLGVALPEDPDEAPFDLLFTPGFSTSPVVTDRSGRGVGLDAVRTDVERMGGSVAVTSRPGAGTDLTLRIPLTLSTVRVLLVALGEEVMGLPTLGLTRLVGLSSEDMVQVEGRPMLLLGDRLAPVVSLAYPLGLSDNGDPDVASSNGVVVEAGSSQVVLLVDGLVGEREVVMKSLGPRLEGVPVALGGTILPSGRVSVILNAGACVRLALSVPSARVNDIAPDRIESPSRKRILLAEDTFTTRALERSILEAAGYEVLAAVDGAEAWHLLNQHGADLVVSDVNMPRMDGFELCGAIRRSAPWQDLPVVLVTSLDSDEDRRRGVEAGADAYVVKSDFEQPVLLETVERLL
jgi:two-component system chemotaxis sensor kinase CheA